MQRRQQEEKNKNERRRQVGLHEMQLNFNSTIKDKNMHHFWLSHIITKKRKKGTRQITEPFQIKKTLTEYINNNR